jgi:hypothetical protein
VLNYSLHLMLSVPKGPWENIIITGRMDRNGEGKALMVYPWNCNGECLEAFINPSSPGLHNLHRRGSNYLVRAEMFSVRSQLSSDAHVFSSPRPHSLPTPSSFTMESLLRLQQRALRQIFTTRRVTLPHQGLRQLSQSAPRIAPRAQTCKFSTRPSNHFPHPPRYRPRKRPSSHQRRYQSSSTHPPENEANLSLSGRLRKLSREYGWSALGVYLLLSALDFPFCFLAVRTLGTDRIGRWEHIVLSYIKSVVPESVLEIEWPWGQGKGNVDGVIDAVDVDMSGKVEMEVGEKRILEEKGEDYKHEPREEEEFLNHGVQEAEKANRGDNASTFSGLKKSVCQYTDMIPQVYGHSSLSHTQYTSPSSF